MAGRDARPTEMGSRQDEEIFREFEHAADLGIEVVAPSRAELFRRAIVAMGRLMLDTTNVRDLENREISIAATDDVDLMHDALSVALRIFMVDSFIWSDAIVNEQSGGLRVRLIGEGFDPSRHEFRQEIKAVTYHQLSVTRLDGEWRARIIFDV